MPSPIKLQDQLQAEVEQRLADAHAQRIQQLTNKLKSSLHTAKVRYPEQRLETIVTSLVQSDHQVQIQALNEQLRRLNNENEQLKLELYVVRQKTNSSDGEMQRASDGMLTLEQQVRHLKREVESASLDLQRGQAAGVAVEKNAAIAEAKAAAAEGALANKSRDLSELQQSYKQLMDAHEQEVHVLRHQAESSTAELQVQSALWHAREQELASELEEYKMVLESQQASSKKLQVRTRPLL